MSAPRRRMLRPWRACMPARIKTTALGTSRRRQGPLRGDLFKIRQPGRGPVCWRGHGFKPVGPCGTSMPGFVLLGPAALPQAAALLTGRAACRDP